MSLVRLVVAFSLLLPLACSLSCPSATTDDDYSGHAHDSHIDLHGSHHGSVPPPPGAPPDFVVAFDDPSPVHPPNTGCAYDGADGSQAGCEPYNQATPAPTAHPITVSMRDVAHLVAHGSGLRRQPDSRTARIDIRMIAYTNPTPQTLTTTLMGHPVTITATPVAYTWDWGDGTQETTTHPGAPYPNDTINHHYTHRSPKTVITLTTTWSAEFSVDGGPTQPIAGHLTTTETSTPFQLVTINSVLTDQAETQTGH